jgi:tetratricopeptide (TPR) repeat protein
MRRYFNQSAISVISSLLIAFMGLSSAAAQEARQRGLEVKVGATSKEVEGGRDIQRWAVIIGISRYKYGDQNVNGVTVPNLVNAADDAQKFYNFLRSPEGGGFRDVKEGGHMILLKDEQATKSSVEQALAGLKNAKPEDYFIIYIAAHGANVPATDPKLNATVEVPYFILHDFNAQDVVNTSMRMMALRELVGQIPAKKGLVLADTCHSAGVLLAGRGMYATTGANTTFINEMSKIPAGIGFISAAGQLQAAQEADEFGGVFTHCLLEGLRGNADINPPDGIVTFGEVNTYLQNAVPKLTEKLTGLRQNPVGNTTTLEANKIPLAVVSYPKTGPCNDPDRCGTLVIRTPDLDGVEVAVNGAPLGAFNRQLERTLRLPVGEQSLSFARGTLKRELKANVEPGQSKVVEINLSFSESNDEAFVAPTTRQLEAFLGDDKPPTQAAERSFKEGVDQFNRQRFSEAIRLLDRAIKENSGAYANAFVYMGRAQQALRQHRQAVESFASALKLRPSDFETQTLLAEAKFSAGGNLQEVIADLKDVIGRHPNFDFARVVYGDVLLLQSALTPASAEQLRKSAEQQLRNAIAINPKSPPAHLILANVLLYSNSRAKQREAVTYAQKALDLFNELAQKKVSALKGLKSLSISHIIFGGARYANDAVLAEAHYIMAKALTRVVEGETVSECETSLNIAEQGSYLDRARPHLEKAERFARSAGDQRRLALVFLVSAQNNQFKGNLPGAIKDGEQALKESAAIPDMKDYPEAHFLLYEAYKSDQKFVKATEHLQVYMRAIGSNMTPEQRKIYDEELQQLRRLAQANQQR